MSNDSLDARDDLTDDAVLGGRLRLLQPRRGHRFGHDAILLAASTAAGAGEHALEFGAGVGTAGLALARRIPGLTLGLVEIDPGLAALAEENARRNGLADRVSVHALDVTALPGWPPVDRVLMNPPFTDRGRHPTSADPRRRSAHAADGELLGRWVTAARQALLQDGTLTLIHRADALGDVLAALDGFGAIAVQPVHPKPAVPAIRILVRATKGSSAPLNLIPGLCLQDGEGRLNAENVMREGDQLPLAAFG